MTNKRVYNFSAGPSQLPLQVLLDTRPDRALHHLVLHLSQFLMAIHHLHAHDIYRIVYCRILHQPHANQTHGRGSRGNGPQVDADEEKPQDSADHRFLRPCHLDPVVPV